MGKTLTGVVMNKDSTVKVSPGEKPLKPILHTHQRQKTLSEGDVPADTDAASPTVRQRRVTFCAPEDNEVFICPPPPPKPWTSKAKKFISKLLTASPAPHHNTQSLGLPGAGVLSF